MIPVSEPFIGTRDRELVLECLESGWISSDGPFVARFEKEFAALIGRKHAIAVTNGSAALEAAVVSLGLKSGDEIILPTFTIISCASAIVRAGCIPVTVDCDPTTWNTAPDMIIGAVTPRTRAIMVAHIYGLPVDMDPILEFAKARGIFVIEDAAEAHGLTYKGRPCGSLGDISTFSFYPNKLITTGEGGMILTDDEVFADKCQSLRNLCFTPRRFVHEDLGWNLRMTSMQAALGIGQLERLGATVVRKRAIGGRYQELLAGEDRIQLPQDRMKYAENGYWVFGFVLGDAVAFDAPEMMRRLTVRGIGTRPFFYPIHEQPVFRRMGLFEGVSHPVAERIARRGLYVPSGITLSDEQIAQVCAAIKDALE